MTALVFRGLRSLLDAQVAADRRPAAVERLRKYAGTGRGFEPITDPGECAARAHRRTRKLLAPARSQVERDLANGPVLIDGMEKLLQQYKPDGWREPFAKVRDAARRAIEQFIRTEILPKARTDFRLPPRTSTPSQLEQVGVDIAPEPLAQAGARSVPPDPGGDAAAGAEGRQGAGLQTTDYRDVIRELKKEQLVGDAILPHYQQAAGGYRDASSASRSW